MERKYVYKLIDDERDYQDSKWDDVSETRNGVSDEPDKNKSVAEWIIYMEKLLNDAKNRIYHLDKEGAMEFIRKTTAVGVACIQVHGCPPRIK